MREDITQFKPSIKGTISPEVEMIALVTDIEKK